MSRTSFLTATKLKKNFADIFHNEYTAWLVLGLSLLITGLGWMLSSQAIDRRANDRFEFEVAEAKERIQFRINQYKQLLRGCVALFDASDLVTREDWRRYVESLDLQNELPGVQGFAFAQKVLPEQLESYQNQIRQEGFAAYAVSPPGSRDIYFPITLIEPFDTRNQRAFGYDMFSEPIRRQAMTRAMESGEATVSGLVYLKQGDERNPAPGFLIYLPVYAEAMDLSTKEGRRKAILGFVYSPFVAGDLMKNVLGNEKIPLQFELYDSASMSRDSLIYQSSGNQANKENTPDFNHRYETVVPIELSGRTWTAHFGSTTEFDNNVQQALPNLILIAGGVIDLLLFLTIYSLVEQRKRESASRAKSLFLANMSHEIRTPLNAIQGLNSLLAEQVRKDPVAAEYVRQVHESSEQLLALVEDVFSFSQLESGPVEVDVVEFDPRERATRTLRLFTQKALAKGLRLELEVDPMTPMVVKGDPVRYTRILTNLLSNAVKFSERGVVRVKLQADQIGSREAVIRTEVHDEGIGCDVSDLNRLTQPFEQADNTTTRKFGGSGLGLAISRKLTELMGGQLFASSTPGVGSVFGFTVRVQAVYSQRQDDAEASTGKQGQLDGKKILVVEDNVLNQQVIKALLTKMHAQVELVDNGQLAVEAVAKDPTIDLVLMDVHMPVMNGLDATVAIRRLPGPSSRLPIVALTAGALKEDEDACRAAGMDEFLTKPVDVPKLRRVLGGFLLATN